jgi:chemotaxis protein methyltransferase CheR
MTSSALASGGRSASAASSHPDLDSLSRACGLHLGAYRVEHVAERVDRALEREGVGSVAELAALARDCADARDRFRRAIAISVTGRFRDPHQFDLLRDDVLPGLLARHGTLRVWSAGCATGLELHGLASLLAGLGALGRTRMLGSDLLADNIDVARAGGGDDVPLTGAAAAAMRWEVRDLLDGVPPAGSFHLILCRNVGIYFAPDARDRLMRMLASALAPGGVLMVGRSERLSRPREYGLEPYRPHTYRRPL